ncbi:hypothetical protein AOQ73_05890 [Bradyrhizobium pachyrhizi]|uniref:hypothetical protein n=1 Tax=Bradyrhizobium pachyrhizi TaxID=280333 RepID=UPI0007053CFC|nr:hypothetical protein [Bradyrhizobium pachyrhizi]KRQ11937.1 hypothetical protein AOQ73_05890 [Bradyrhizobium pachyrhizi]
MTAYVPGINETDPKAQNRSLHQLASGRSNAVGIVTLTPSATSTTVTDANCAVGTVPKLVPTTPNAAAALTGIYIPIATITNGSFVIQHASAATNDRTFLYALQG